MSMNFITDIIVNSNNSIQTKKIKAPTSSGGSTYGLGTSGQVLTTNGSSVYWKACESIASRPQYQAGVTDYTLQPLVSDLRANHFAFLPADQIIIEKTTDGGLTWADAGVSDADKAALFAETRPSIKLPLLNGDKSILCGLRVTFTAMKYNVPANTAETQKYNYWNTDYVSSTERYNNIQEIYVWINVLSDKMNIKVERATGKAPTTWVTAFDDNNILFSGWSGNDYIKLSAKQTFGGAKTQTTNYWNYRITFMSAYNAGASAFNENYLHSAQVIQEIRGYGTNWYTRGNQYASSDHIYSWDTNQNVTFPGSITATNYIGKINGVTVPANPVFTDTTYSSLAAASGGTNVSLVTTGEKYIWNSAATELSNLVKLPTVTSSDNNKVLQVSNGAWALSNNAVTTLYRQFWTSTDSISLTLAQDGKTYYIWCAASTSGNSGAIGDASFGALIFVSNGTYVVLHKGTEITIDETSSVLTVTSTANIAMAIVEM